MGERIDTETGEIIPAETSPTTLSLDDAMALIHRTHGAAVDKNDPMMWGVTLHQAMVEDYKAMLGEHNRQVKTLLDGASAACIDAVNEHLNRLSDKTMTASIGNALALVDQQARAMQALEDRLFTHRQTVIRASALTGFFLVCSLIVFFLLLK